MTTPRLHARIHSGSGDLPLLVLLPSLGTAAEALWSEAAALMAGYFQIVMVDLPGHGRSAPNGGPFGIEDLARATLAAIAPLRGDRLPLVAGVSIGGAITLSLAQAFGAEISGGIILNSAAKIGEAAAWLSRADLVLSEGTAALREGSKARWFAPGFTEARPDLSQALLASLEAADAPSYAALCAALAHFDLRGSLGAIAHPLMVIGGNEDLATPPASQEEIALAVPGARLLLLDTVAHLAPAEAPGAVAEAILAYQRGLPQALWPSPQAT
ncbi:alpha/beta fold hydrolase [Falsigemmobacter intermedius]|uniref:alpha/beta fold hydrolase n=1 Tax=Falsigemmobacter intermedius TaxID=1553448 RepID=UPI003F070B1F